MAIFRIVGSRSGHRAITRIVFDVTEQKNDPRLQLQLLVPSWDLAMRSEAKSENTRKLYKRGTAAYFEWCDSKDQFPTLDKVSVQTFIAESMEQLNRTASTMKDYLKGLKSFARWCLAEGEVEHENISAMAPPGIGSKIRPSISEEYHDAMLATCNTTTFAGKRDTAILRLLRDAGPRAAEIVGLTTDDIVISKGFAIVRGKGDKDRFIAFGTDTTLALDRYLRARRSHKRADGKQLWLGAKGTTFGYSGLRHMIERRAEAAGVPKAHAHMWRRLWAHNWLDRGGSTDGLKALAGWTTDAMVQHYTEEFAMQRALKEARKLFNEE